MMEFTYQKYPTIKRRKESYDFWEGSDGGASGGRLVLDSPGAFRPAGGRTRLATPTPPPPPTFPLYGLIHLIVYSHIGSFKTNNDIIIIDENVPKMITHKQTLAYKHITVLHSFIEIPVLIVK